MRGSIEDFDELFPESDFPGLYERLKAVKSISEIDSVVINEETRFDDGDDKDYHYEYEVPRPVSSVFADPRSIEPSFQNSMSVIGEFVAPDYTERREHGWSCFREFPFLLQLNSYSKLGLSYFRFLVVGDKTVEQYSKGNKTVLYEAIKHQKEYGYIIITESDFWSMGDYVPPKVVGSVDSWNGKNVTFFGTMTSMSLSKAYSYVKKLGGVPSTKLRKDTDIVVVTQEELTNRQHDDEISRACRYYANTCKPAFLSEEAFCERITASPSKSDKPASPVLQQTESLPLSGKSFIITGFVGSQNTALKKTVSVLGGAVKSRVAKSTDYVVYNSKEPDPNNLANVRDARSFNVNGAKITIMTEIEFNAMIKKL